LRPACAPRWPSCCRITHRIPAATGRGARARDGRDLHVRKAFALGNRESSTQTKPARRSEVRVFNWVAGSASLHIAVMPRCRTTLAVPLSWIAPYPVSPCLGCLLTYRSCWHRRAHLRTMRCCYWLRAVTVWDGRGRGPSRPDSLSNLQVCCARYRRGRRERTR